jgi:hypothetical protein
MDESTLETACDPRSEQFARNVAAQHVLSAELLDEPADSEPT